MILVLVHAHIFYGMSLNELSSSVFPATSVRSQGPANLFRLRQDKKDKKEKKRKAKELSASGQADPTGAGVGSAEAVREEDRRTQQPPCSY